MRRAPRSVTSLLSLVFAVSTVLCLLPLRWAAAQQPANPNIGGGDKTPPVVIITPATGTDTVVRLAVSITWCDNVSLDAGSKHVVMDGVDVSAGFSYQTITQVGCGAAGLPPVL